MVREVVLHEAKEQMSEAFAEFELLGGKIAREEVVATWVLENEGQIATMEDAEEIAAVIEAEVEDVTPRGEIECGEGGIDGGRWTMPYRI